MAKIKESSIAELKDKIDSKALVENYVKLELRGDKWWGCCPFHGEKTPSFNLDAQRNLFYCFGCGKGGSIITFIEEIEHLSFVEAIEFIAKKIGFRLQYELEDANFQKNNKKEELLNLYAKVARLFHTILTKQPQGKEAYSYLKMRGITDETIESFQLGYAPKNRLWLHAFLQKKSYHASFLATSGLFSQKYPKIAFFYDRIMFPICDRYGATIAFGGRKMRGEDVAKYINSKDMEQYKKGANLFAFSQALQEIRKQKCVILCEGYMDVIAYHQAGIKYAVAPLGTALTEVQAQFLKNLCDLFYLSFDSDKAGQKATERAILMLRKIGAEVYVIDIKDEKDPADILKNEGAQALSLLVKNAIIDVEYLLLMVENRFSLSNSHGKISAIASFFPYMASLSSTVMKEEVVKRLSNFFKLQEASILSDYNKFLKGEKAVRDERVEIQRDPYKVNRRELRLLLAVVADRKLFAQMRSKVRAEDFESASAKMVYIALEECFREGIETFEEFLAKIDDERLKGIIKRAIASDEFINNSSEILNDGIRLIDLNRLKKRRAILVNKINVLISKNEDGKDLRDLLMEKSELDAQIFSYKKTMLEGALD